MPGESPLATAFVLAADAAGGRAGPVVIAGVVLFDGNPPGDLCLVATPWDILDLVIKNDVTYRNGL